MSRAWTRATENRGPVFRPSHFASGNSPQVIPPRGIGATCFPVRQPFDGSRVCPFYKPRQGFRQAEPARARLMRQEVSC
jgi:hypothetical protein